MQAPDNTNGRTPAELIFTGGRVHTVNATNDIVEAVAVCGGRILAVASTADIRALAGPGTREIALRGRSLLAVRVFMTLAASSATPSAPARTSLRPGA